MGGGLLSIGCQPVAAMPLSSYATFRCGKQRCDARPLVDRTQKCRNLSPGKLGLQWCVYLLYFLRGIKVGGDESCLPSKVVVGN